MRQRLFWKILLGFWFTCLAITQGTWLVFNLMTPPPERSEYERGMASMAVAAAASALNIGGIQDFNKQISTWPRDQRRALKIGPVVNAPDDEPVLASQTATAPDGKNYRIFYLPRPPRAVSLFNIFEIPKEIVLMAAGGGLLFSAVLAWYLTQPMRRIAAGFGKLAQGDFSVRLAPAIGRRRDEIADLVRGFDAMAIRLEELVSARDRLLADVSHELRTPLARLNLAIELLRQDPSRLSASLDRISGEATKLDEMVGELLILAKLESGQEEEAGYANLEEIVKGVVTDARYEAAAKGVNVMMQVAGGPQSDEWIVRGSGRLISRAIENVVRNAVRYSPRGGNVHVHLQNESGKFRLRVDDEGPGVPADMMAKLFKPFGLSSDGFGFGLGLAIAHRAIVVHGGSISASNRRPTGFEVALALPSANIESA